MIRRWGRRCRRRSRPDFTTDGQPRHVLPFDFVLPMSASFTYESLFVRRATRRRARIRLVCFGWAGAGASMFAEWPALLPGEIEVLAVQLPGREDRIAESPRTDFIPLVGAVAQALRPYVDLQYAVFGHSAGALMAFEVARALRRHSPPSHLFVSAQPAPHLPPRHPPIHELPPDEFAACVRQLDGTAGDIFENDDLLQLVLPALRADFSWGERYEFTPGPPLLSAITALGGVEDPRVSACELDAWHEHTASRFARLSFAGGHFFLNDNTTAVVGALSQALL